MRRARSSAVAAVADSFRFRTLDAAPSSPDMVLLVSCGPDALDGEPLDGFLARHSNTLHVVENGAGSVCGLYSAFTTNQHPFGVSYGVYSYPFVFVEALYVLPAFRGRGVGRAIMQQLDSTAHQQGCNWLVTGVRLQNSAAVQFLERHGFAAYVHIFRLP